VPGTTNRSDVTHVNLAKSHPAPYKALMALDGEAATACTAAGLDHLLVELVKVRVSQINGCAFCLRMHTRDALAHGETTDRLAVVAAWWESQYFSPVERAALALAEQITQPGAPERPQPDRAALTDEQVSAISWLVIVINAWNRVAVTSHFPVG
jgi:AhpD family alkylhydroperoxidase